MKNIVGMLCMIVFVCGFWGCDEDPLDDEVIESAQSSASSGGGSGTSSAFTPGSMNITCSGVGSKPATNVHCLAVGGATAPHYYGETRGKFGTISVLGTWQNSIGCVMTLRSDGTASFKVSPSATTLSGRWGVLINSNGNSAGGSTNLYVSVVESDYGDLIEPQFGSGVFYSTSGIWSNGWTR